MLKKKICRVISLIAMIGVVISLVACGKTNDAESVVFDDGTKDTVNSGYSLNGTELESYGVYYAWRDTNGEKKGATELVDKIKQITGVSLTVKSDYEGLSEYSIVVGDSEHCKLDAEALELANMEYYVHSADGVIQLLSLTKYGYIQAAAKLCESFADSKTITLGSTDKLSYESMVLSTMTFNIYNWDTSADHLQRIISVIKKFQPDTVGFQEITDTWISNIMADSEISAMYGKVGDSREDDTEEQCAIFYRKDKLKLISYDTKWLYGDSESVGSETAGKLRASLYNRIYTYAVFERLLDGKQIAHINIHLDLANDAANRITVQSQQVGYALNMAQQLMADENIRAIVFTGDFNAKKEEKPCTMITDAGFIYAQDESDRNIGNIVEGEYYKDTTNTICKWIDHIFIKGDNIYFEEYEICNQKYRGEYPSDHLPRIARYIIQ